MKRFSILLVLLLLVGLVVPALAQGEETFVTVMHYFTGELGRAALNDIFTAFQEESGLTVFDNPIGHEDFKTTILVMAAGGDLPDMFSYWAGARVQFVVDSGALAPIDDMWDANNLSDVVPASIAEGATIYNGQRYLIPFGYHYVGMFYNPTVMAQAGVTEFPHHLGRFPGPVRHAPGRRRDAHRARLAQPLAGTVLVRLPVAAHCRAGIPRPPDGR